MMQQFCDHILHSFILFHFIITFWKCWKQCLKKRQKKQPYYIITNSHVSFCYNHLYRLASHSELHHLQDQNKLCECICKTKCSQTLHLIGHAKNREQIHIPGKPYKWQTISTTSTKSKGKEFVVIMKLSAPPPPQPQGDVNVFFLFWVKVI